MKMIVAVIRPEKLEAVQQAPQEDAVELFRRYQTRLNDELERLSRGEVDAEEFLASVGMSSDEAAALFRADGGLRGWTGELACALEAGDTEPARRLLASFLSERASLGSDDTAEVLGCSIAAVKSLVARGSETLRTTVVEGEDR